MLLNGLASFLPQVVVLPFGIDAVLVQGMGYLFYLMDVFPPIRSLWLGILFVLGFKLSLKLVAVIPIIKGLLYK